MCMTKPTKWPVRPAKTQISLGNHPVWSESSLSAQRSLGFRAHREDSDQTGRSESSQDAQVILFVLSCTGPDCLRHFLGCFHTYISVVKVVKKVRPTIKLFSFLFSKFTFNDINDSVSYWIWHIQKETALYLILCKGKNDLQKLVPRLKFWVSSCKMGLPLIKSLPCNGLFDQNFPYW